jgi:hypothetical protein
MQPDRATALLAVIRIVAVLGMSFAIAAGIFILLWGKILIGLGVTLCALPFFFLMRYMETHFADPRAYEEPSE